MCLILLAVAPRPGVHLIVAANRDEQHARPTALADYWSDNGDVLGGRDLQAKGTWLGITSAGRFAAVTNFAETPPDPVPPRSRGDLTRDFLENTEATNAYLAHVADVGHQYRGFNLVVFDGKKVGYYSNREATVRELEPGFYGLSNQLLNCDWPKVMSGRQRLQQQLHTGFEPEALFNLLGCRGDGTNHSARFILGESYGTRASTVVKITDSENYFEERCFDPNGHITSHRVFLP